MGVLPSLKHLSWYYVELTFVDRMEKYETWKKVAMG